LRIVFFIWASRRGLGGAASKRRKHPFTSQRRETLSPPAAPSGFLLQCFLSSRGVCDTPLRTTYFVWAYRMRPHAKKHFRFNPSLAPVRDISPFRGEPSNPFACTFFPRREPRFRTFSRKNGNIVRICLQTCNRRRGWSRFRVLLALRVGESVKKCVCRFKTTASNRKRLHSLSR